MTKITVTKEAKKDSQCGCTETESCPDCIEMMAMSEQIKFIEKKLKAEIFNLGWGVEHFDDRIQIESKTEAGIVVTEVTLETLEITHKIAD